MLWSKKNRFFTRKTVANLPLCVFPWFGRTDFVGPIGIKIPGTVEQWHNQKGRVIECLNPSIIFFFYTCITHVLHMYYTCINFTNVL